MMRTPLMLAATAALAAGLAFAQAPAGRKAPALGKIARLQPRIVRALDLTAPQKQQAKQIFQQANQSGKPIRQQLQENRQALAEAIKTNNIVQIQQLSTNEGGLQGQLVNNRSTALAKFYAILTPDQQAKLDQMMKRLKNPLKPAAAAGAGL